MMDIHNAKNTLYGIMFPVKTFQMVYNMNFFECSNFQIKYVKKVFLGGISQFRSHHFTKSRYHFIETEKPCCPTRVASMIFGSCKTQE